MTTRLLLGSGRRLTDGDLIATAPKTRERRCTGEIQHWQVRAAVAPPRPRANPVLGSALELRRSLIRTYERAMREHGDVVRLVVGPPGLRFDLYCVFHPDGVKAVLAGSRAGYSKAQPVQRADRASVRLGGC